MNIVDIQSILWGLLICISLGGIKDRWNSLLIDEGKLKHQLHQIILTLDDLRALDSNGILTLVIFLDFII